MDKGQKKSSEKFNSITQKTKPENQNQTHNARSEAVETKNRQVSVSFRVLCLSLRGHGAQTKKKPKWLGFGFQEGIMFFTSLLLLFSTII